MHQNRIRRKCWEHSSLLFVAAGTANPYFARLSGTIPSGAVSKPEAGSSNLGEAAGPTQAAAEAQPGEASSLEARPWLNFMI
jgi:hypothetical protein